MITWCWQPITRCIQLQFTCFGLSNVSRYEVSTQGNKRVATFTCVHLSIMLTSCSIPQAYCSTWRYCFFCLHLLICSHSTFFFRMQSSYFAFVFLALMRHFAPPTPTPACLSWQITNDPIRITSHPELRPSPVAVWCTSTYFLEITPIWTAVSESAAIFLTYR